LQKVIWPCVWDGPAGPISKRWNIPAVPRNFVLDAKGIVRYRDVYGEDLIRAIEGLLKEMNPSRAAYQPTPEVTEAPTSSRSRSSRSSINSRSNRPFPTSPRSRIPRAGSSFPNP
jgi:hypothetical protein